MASRRWGGAILGTPEVRGPWRRPRRLRYTTTGSAKSTIVGTSSMKLSNVECLPVHIFAICFIRITVPREVRAAGLLVPILGGLHQ